MSLMEWRGGFPVVFTGTVATTGVVTDARGNAYVAGEPIELGAHQVQAEENGRKGPVTSKWLIIRNHGPDDDFRVYFSQDHYDDDVHYLTLDARGVGGDVLHSSWEGPAEAQRLWLRAVSGTPAFEITAFARRA